MNRAHHNRAERNSGQAENNGVRSAPTAMADREEGRKAFLFNRLFGPTGPVALIENKRHLNGMATRRRASSGTKNPGGLAGLTGVHHGSRKQSEQAISYRKNGALS
ncbi:hypothetical protein [Brevundimonas sp. NPDC058933]|uniref:hypothetical protein n=1 Tax=Brevundimonas sp. NPDC058933 TaxID=3346673 RepID=UPI003BEED74F